MVDSMDLSNGDLAPWSAIMYTTGHMRSSTARPKAKNISRLSKHNSAQASEISGDAMPTKKEIADLARFAKRVRAGKEPLTYIKL